MHGSASDRTANAAVKTSTPPDGGVVGRTGRDSNPRYRCRYAGFRDRFLQPLGHLSNSLSATEATLLIQPGPAANRRISSARAGGSGGEENNPAAGALQATDDARGAVPRRRH